MRGLVIALMLTLPGPGNDATAEESPWYELYEKALDMVERGRYLESADLLKAAISQRPEPRPSIRTYSLRYVDYLPYLFLGICYTEIGKSEIAQEYFELSERHGAVLQSREGEALFKQYRLRLSNNMVLAELDEEPSGGLNQMDYENLERQVMNRCRVDRERTHRDYPWYYHYELAVELLKRRDPSRALTNLLDALGKKQQPQRLSRLYGMWYLNYAPYFNIGLAHYDLGNYECARDAFDVSSDLKELTASEESYGKRERLREAAEQKTRQP